MTKTDELVTAHLPCDDCSSSDGLSYFSDGHTFCFVCRKYTADAGEPPAITSSTKWEEDNDYTMTQPLSETSPPKSTRGLFEDDLTRFHCSVTNKGQTVFAHQNEAGVIVAQKIAVPAADGKAKRFIWEGKRWDKNDPKNPTNALPLYGQHLWSTGSFRDQTSSIVITEGEYDAISVSASFEKTQPAVSLPDGATNLKPLAAAVEWLDQFDEIVLMFDNDAPGQDAVKKALEILPRTKTKVAKLAGFKDANDAFAAGKASSVREAVWSASVPVPDGLINGSALIKEALEPFPKGIDLPWPTISSYMNGARLGEFTTWCGGAGTGKSSFMRILARHYVGQGERVGFMMTEESNEVAAKYQVALEAGVSIDTMHTVSKEVLEAAADVSLASKMYWFDDAVDLASMESRISFMFHTLGIRYFLLDHISMMVVDSDEERKAIDRLMKALKDIVVKLPIHIDVVCHLKKSGGDIGHEEGRTVRMDDLRGSAGIKQMSFNIIAIERDQQAEDGDANILTMRALKQRYVPRQGVMGQLAYNPETGHFTEHVVDGKNAFSKDEWS